MLSIEYMHQYVMVRTHNAPRTDLGGIDSSAVSSAPATETAAVGSQARAGRSVSHNAVVWSFHTAVMDAVQVPAIGVPANNSFGLLLVGVGLLCLGVGVGWWWTRTARHEVAEDQADAREKSTPNSRDEEDRSSEDISGDTGGFVFATDGSDEQELDFADQESRDDDAAKPRKE